MDVPMRQMLEPRPVVLPMFAGFVAESLNLRLPLVQSDI